MFFYRRREAAELGAREGSVDRANRHVRKWVPWEGTRAALRASYRNHRYVYLFVAVCQKNEENSMIPIIQKTKTFNRKIKTKTPFPTIIVNSFKIVALFLVLTALVRTR